MSTLVRRIRALLGSGGNSKAHQADVRSDELQAYQQQHRTLLVGRGVICWWSGLPMSGEENRKTNGRAPSD